MKRRARGSRSVHPVGPGVGFAVLGGAFGEGIDLPGARWIGALSRPWGWRSSIPSMNRSSRDGGAVYAVTDYTLPVPRRAESGAGCRGGVTRTRAIRARCFD